VRYTVVLPYPPSANRLWRVRQGFPRLSQEGKQFKHDAAILALAAGVPKFTGPVTMTIVVFRPLRRGDLDNRVKATLDALQGVAYVDDEQVAELHAYRREDKARPRIEVTIEAGIRTAA
jgi:crossover junction endodeoxyribonuclease RusA